MGTSNRLIGRETAIRFVESFRRASESGMEVEFVEAFFEYYSSGVSVEDACYEALLSWDL